MRAFLMAALFSLAASTGAFADESVAGNWKADLGQTSSGQAVTMNMQVAPDGKWNSETLQGDRTVRRMAGTYTQTQPSGNKPGQLVFTPRSVSGAKRRAMTERDSYTLSDNGQELRLTSGGDTMVFQKQGQ